MPKPHHSDANLAHWFGGFANNVARISGRPAAFILALAVVLVWAVTGPLFEFSDTWQLVINTGTTIITFLMVFVIQNSQYRDNLALQTKLDELIRASKAANRFIGIEDMTDEEIEEMRKKCEVRAKKQSDIKLDDSTAGTRLPGSRRREKDRKTG